MGLLNHTQNRKTYLNLHSIYSKNVQQKPNVLITILTMLHHTNCLKN